MSRFESWIEKGIFASRWFQAPLYAAAYPGILYAYKFTVGLIHLFLTKEGKRPKMVPA